MRTFMLQTNNFIENRENRTGEQNGKTKNNNS